MRLVWVLPTQDGVSGLLKAVLVAKLALAGVADELRRTQRGKASKQASYYLRTVIAVVLRNLLKVIRFGAVEKSPSWYVAVGTSPLELSGAQGTIHLRE